MPMPVRLLSVITCEPAGIRTPDPLLKREMLLPTELPVHELPVQRLSRDGAF